MRRVRSFLALEGDRKGLFLEATFRLCVAWVAVSWLPFRWIAGSLGRPRSESTHEERPDELPTLARVVWAIELGSRSLPWTSTCLMQAAAAQWMLRRRGLPGTLYLGLARDGTSGELLAHAWLRSGERVLTGGADLERGYTVVGSFADEEQR